MTDPRLFCRSRTGSTRRSDRLRSSQQKPDARPRIGLLPLALPSTSCARLSFPRCSLYRAFFFPGYPVSSSRLSFFTLAFPVAFGRTQQARVLFGPSWSSLQSHIEFLSFHPKHVSLGTKSGEVCRSSLLSRPEGPPSNSFSFPSFCSTRSRRLLRTSVRHTPTLSDRLASGLHSAKTRRVGLCLFSRYQQLLAGR